VSSSACEEEEVAKNNVELLEGDEGMKGRTPMSMTIWPEVQIRRSAICAGTLRSRKRGPACAMRHRGLDLPQFVSGYFVAWLLSLIKWPGVLKNEIAVSRIHRFLDMVDKCPTKWIWHTLGDANQ
jgi:hypothetical protein